MSTHSVFHFIKAETCLSFPKQGGSLGESSTMGLKSHLSTHYHPRCLLYRRPGLLDFYHDLSAPHLSWFPHLTASPQTPASSKPRVSMSLCRVPVPSAVGPRHCAGLRSLPTPHGACKWQSDVCLSLTRLRGTLMGVCGKVED